MAFTPDGRQAISGGRDQLLRVWETERGRSLRTLEGHAYPLSAVAIAPDSRRAVSGEWVSGPDEQTLRVWEITSGQCLHELHDHRGTISSIAVTPDGRRAISGGGTPYIDKEDYAIRIWDLDSGQRTHTLEGLKGCTRILAVTPDGRRAVSGGELDVLRVWDLRDGRCLNAVDSGTDVVNALAITPDGRVAISGGGYGYTTHDARLLKYILRLWDTETGSILHFLRGHSESVTSVATTPDGRLAVSASWDATLRVWDLRSGQCLQVLQGHSTRINAVAITSDGRRVLSSSRDQTLRIWDIASGRTIALSAEPAYIQALALNNHLLMTGDDAGGVVFSELRNCNLSAPLVTAVRLYEFDRGTWAEEICTFCRWCGRRFIPDAVVLDAIIAQNAGAYSDRSPCLGLPDAAWEEPRLLSECPNCHQPLKFNPFTVDHRELH